MNYPINDIYPCIQGEGVLTGVPMIMLRFQGCDVGCPFCDTKETWHLEDENKDNLIIEVLGQTPRYTIKTQSQILAYIKKNHPSFEWVLVSGGEPALCDLGPLVNALHDGGLKVAIETSGTEAGHVGAVFDWVCVSPKQGMPGGKQVLTIALNEADEVKQVIGKRSHITELDALLEVMTPKEGLQICLQPISQSEKATRLCIEVVQERGWRLSVQMHKYLKIL